MKNGIQKDNRTKEELQKDYHFDEIVASGDPVIWTSKPQNTWRSFPLFSQNGSGSCVAQSVAKMLGAMYQQIDGAYVHFSATHIYQQRTNRPQGGMIANDALDIARRGVTLEELVPSQNMSDREMDSVPIPEYKKRVGEVFKAGNYIHLPLRNIDAVASVIQRTGKPVMVWYWFTHREWTETPTLRDNPPLYGGSTTRHAVVAVDYTMINGKKCLIVEDSWTPQTWEGAKRIITEDFHNKRNFHASYFMNFLLEETEKPKIKLTKTLRFNMRDNEVILLQDFLKSQGLFPHNTQSTGFFGSITKNAVIAFQNKHGLIADGIVGKKTRSVINMKSIA